mgnify:CR=1 FL=1
MLLVILFRHTENSGSVKVTIFQPVGNLPSMVCLGLIIFSGMFWAGLFYGIIKVKIFVNQCNKTNRIGKI